MVKRIWADSQGRGRARTHTCTHMYHMHTHICMHVYRISLQIIEIIYSSFFSLMILTNDGSDNLGKSSYRKSCSNASHYTPQEGYLLTRSGGSSD